MTPQRTKKAKRIFERAAQIENDSQRQAYVVKACGSDVSLMAEVESLLVQHDRGAGVLEAYSSLTGSTLLHYQILEKIGHGGTAFVYKARDLHLGRVVVLKVLQPLVFAEAEYRRRFFQEARCASALNHPNIVTIHEIAQDRGIDFIVMEFVPGKTLDAVIPSKGLPVPTCLNYALQVADALAAAHEAGVAHRDLKPSNIRITKEDRVKLLDFGLAKPSPGSILTAKPDQNTRQGAILGTLGYMSPEQVRGQESDARSDVFAFGLVLHEMLTGRPVFKRESAMETMAAVLQENVPSPGPRAPEKLRRILRRSLEKDPDRRYQTMSEVLTELKALPASSGPSRARKRSRPEKVWRWGALVMAGILVCAAVFALWPRSHPRPASTKVVVAQVEGTDSWLARSIAKAIEATRRDSDVEIALLGKSVPRDQTAAFALKEAQAQHASIIVWGLIERTAQRAIIRAHVGLPNASAVLPFPSEIELANLAAADLRGAAMEERLAKAVRPLILAAVGVLRFEAREGDRGIEAFSQVLAEPTPILALDLSVIHFYRGLALQAKNDVRHCLDDKTPPCNLTGAISDLARSVEDFDGVLKARPHHGGSLWNRGLALSGLCALQNRGGQTAEAAGDCERGINDFTAAISPAPPKAGFFSSVPDPADVFWNRGLTHLLYAELAYAERPLRLREYTNALSDFDELLRGAARYASFLKNRRDDVLRHRVIAQQEKARLAARDGR